MREEYRKLIIKEQGPWTGAIELLQLVLEVGGMVPVIGLPFDAANAGISFARGHVLEASLFLLAAIPLIGDAASAERIARRGINAVEAAGMEERTAGRLIGIFRNVDEGAEVTKAVQQARINLAAALDSGYITRDHVVDSLKKMGRDENAARLEADRLIAEARAAASGVDLEKSRKFFAPTAGSANVEAYRASIGAYEFVGVAGIQYHQKTCVPAVLQQRLGKGSADGLRPMFEVAERRNGYTLEKATEYLRNTELAKDSVYQGRITVDALREQTAAGNFTLLNVKGNPGGTGAHAIGIEGFDAATGRFLIHDPLLGTRYWQTGEVLQARMIGDAILVK